MAPRCPDSLPMAQHHIQNLMMEVEEPIAETKAALRLAKDMLKQIREPLKNYKSYWFGWTVRDLDVNMGHPLRRLEQKLCQLRLFVKGVFAEPEAVSVRELLEVHSHFYAAIAASSATLRRLIGCHSELTHAKDQVLLSEKRHGSMDPCERQFVAFATCYLCKRLRSMIRRVTEVQRMLHDSYTERFDTVCCEYGLVDKCNYSVHKLENIDSTSEEFVGLSDSEDNGSDSDDSGSDSEDSGSDSDDSGSDSEDSGSDSEDSGSDSGSGREDSGSDSESGIDYASDMRRICARAGLKRRRN